jgi:hypothetical protein
MPSPLANAPVSQDEKIRAEQRQKELQQAQATAYEPSQEVPTIQSPEGTYVPMEGLTPDVASDLYRDAVSDWYNIGLTPEGTLSSEIQYDPYLIDTEQLNLARAYDYDPMRREAMNRLEASQQGQYQTALTNLASSTGLTAADRMALASQYNRGLLGSQAGLAGEIGTAEAKNIWETDVANQELLNKAYLQNLELQNQAQIGNIGTLRDERRRMGDIARDMYERDIRIGKAKEFADQL